MTQGFLLLVAYRGEYTPREPTLFYPRDTAFVRAEPGKWRWFTCTYCDKTFQEKADVLCCSRDCAARALGREPERDANLAPAGKRRAPKAIPAVSDASTETPAVETAPEMRPSGTYETVEDPLVRQADA